MNGAAVAPSRPELPTWCLLTFFTLLVVPFHPYWLDFEQVRRGLLLGLSGVCLIALPRLQPVRGEVLVWAFVGALLGCAAISWLGATWFLTAGTTATFQPWDAIYRIAHWLALLVVLRLGAATGVRAALPLAGLLAATCAFGLLQRLGLGEIAGYGVEREPVSVFGNLNVASEWTAIAAMAVAVLLPHYSSPRARGLAHTTLVLAGCYLLVNQSRSGLIALPIGLALLLVLRWRDRAFLPMVLVVAGALVGLLLTTAVPRPDAVSQQAARAEQKRSTSTLAVRFEIAKGTTKLWAQSPIFGKGPGQFAVNYPSVRSQEEIEASSHGRQFATEVRTAHDDWLELLVDGGLLAMAMFAAMLFGLQRGQRDKARLLPLFVLLLLMLARAPLWNAPAAAIALCLVGTPAAATTAQPRWRLPANLALGLLLCALGLPLVVGNQLAASWQRAVAHGEQPPMQDVAAAAWCMPFEPRWFEILTREKLAAGDLQGAAHAAAKALQLRPHHPQLYLNLAEVLARGNKYKEARSVARQGLALDPAHPELRAVTSVALAQLDDVEGAIAAVVERPHAVWRPLLARHFADLARLADDRKQSRAAERFLIEHHFVAAVDLRSGDSTAAALTINEHVARMTAAMTTAEASDARPLVLGALALLDLGKPQDAISLGEAASKFRPLLPWQRELLGSQLDRLRAIEAWVPIVGAR